METLGTGSGGTPGPKVFNGVIETGLRVVVVLDAMFETSVDLNTVCLLDHYVVHTQDVGGPESLHPATAVRAGEYLVRRRLVEEALEAMLRMRLVVVTRDEAGIGFVCSEDAAAVVDLMRTDYNVALRQRAGWLATRIREEGLGFVDRMRARIEELATTELAVGQAVSRP